MGELDLEQLPKESLIALVRDKINSEKAHDDALKKVIEDKEKLEKSLQDSQKALENSFMVGGMVTEKIKDVPTICKIVKLDEYYATFLEQMLPKKPDYFLNAINARIHPLIERNKLEIQDAQVDESGEALITSVEDIEKNLFGAYGDAGMIDEKFPKAYSDSRAKFFAFKNMLYKWQQYMVDTYNLMLASQHAYLHFEKARNPNTLLVIETTEAEENKKIQELEAKLEEEAQARRKLEAKFGELMNQVSQVKAEEFKEQDLNVLEEAKAEAGTEEGDLPSPPEPEERSRRRRRE